MSVPPPIPVRDRVVAALPFALIGGGLAMIYIPLGLLGLGFLLYYDLEVRGRGGKP